MMKKFTLLFIALIAFSFLVKAQDVNIPDANFKAALVANTNINTNGDTQIQVSEANAYTSNIAVQNMGISDLTGIEAFTEINKLSAFGNPITIMDLSQNTKITQLLIESTSVSGILDLSHMLDLTDFKAHTTTITAVDVSNGNNTNFTRFVIPGTTTCVKIDAGFNPNSNWSTPGSAIYNESCPDFPCTVNIPDANFKTYLVNNTAINTNGNTKIECTEANAFMGTISCNSLSISDLTGIEAFTNLTVLECVNNQISSVDLSNNTQLEDFRCTDNQISTLDFTFNPLLEIANCGNNTLTSVDITNNSVLEYLYLHGNQLTDIDISDNPNIRIFTAENNPLLSSLNVANGNNNNFNVFGAYNCPNLACVQVDDLAYSNANWINFISINTSFSEDCSVPPCTVNIPDANFKSYLVGNTDINTNGDTEIQCTEASAFSGQIYCPNLDIADLTGIEAFTALTNLRCGYNDLTNIDITQNTALTYFECYHNDLTNIDVTQNTALIHFDCQENDIISIDVSNNTSLQIFSCSNNNLSSIDVSNNLALTQLYTNFMSLGNIDVSNNTNLSFFWCEDNSLTSLDVSNNPNLTELICLNNLLTSLDVSNNPNLTRLDCSKNSLASLDVSNNPNLVRLELSDNSVGSIDVSNNTSLQIFNCNNNSISDIDISYSTSLWHFYADSNSLVSLNIANGNNTNFGNMHATGNPDLSCIEVDDAAWSTTNWTDIDVTTSFSENCNVVLVNSISVQGQSGISTIATQGGNLQMEANVLPTNASDATYTWSITDGASLATMSSSGILQALANGSVTVTATANDGSNIQGSATIIITNQSVGLNDISTQNLNIYPNPARDIVRIETELEIIQSRFYTIHGQEVLHARGEEINIQHLPKGIYFVKVETTDGIIGKKIVKE